MSDLKKSRIIAVVFSLIMAVAILTSGYLIFHSPARLSATTGGNYTANLMNGGTLLDDGDYIYYSHPSVSGVWCVKSDGTENEQISKNGFGNIQTDSGSYFYNENGNLVCTASFGQNPQVLVEGAKNAYVVGDRVYYINNEGYVCKYMSWNGETRQTNIKPAGQMIVYSAKIFYIADDGFIHRCSLDGSDDKVIKDAKAEKFAIDGKLMYVQVDNEVRIISIADENTDVVTLCKADMFTVNNGWIVYNADGKCMLGNLNKMLSDESYTPEVILETPAISLQIGDNGFFIFTEEKLMKLPFETGKVEEFLTVK